MVASRVSGRLSVPALLMFLVIGMLAGSEGIGGVRFDDPWTAQLLGVVALTFILFAGGFHTDWGSIRPVVGRGLSLSTVGVIITASLVGLFAVAVSNFSLLEGLLLGAIISSTDAAAVFTILRSKKISLKGELKPLLELESGSNDPMAVFLTVGIIGLITGSVYSAADLIPFFVWQMALGAVSGYLVGKGTLFIVNHMGLEYEGLYPVLTLAMVLFTYGMTASLGGNGFLAVYIIGLVMGNSDFVQREGLMRFHDGFAWLMQITMFLTLGLLVYPSQVLSVLWVGLAISIFLMLVARPLAVFAALQFTNMSRREKGMVSWVGLRGAAPIVLATFPLLAGVPQADMIFNLVFFIVITSVLIQGISIPMVARWLEVDAR